MSKKHNNNHNDEEYQGIPWEMETIKAAKIEKNEQYILIEWVPTEHDTKEKEYMKKIYYNDVKQIKQIGYNKHRIIWKDTWMHLKAVPSANKDINAAKLLVKLKKFASQMAYNQQS